MRSDLQENSRHVSSLMQKIVEDMYEGLSHTALACEKQDIFDAACSYHAWKWGFTSAQDYTVQKSVYDLLKK